GEYLGARNVKFAIHPGSALKSKPPDWVMAAELVETSRLWARTCAAIKPEWVEAAAPHLARRTHAEPRWSAKRGAAVITERVLVYGLPVVTGRVVPLNQIDPALARELFIRHALVEGEWACDHAFHKQNRELIERAEERAARSRSTRPPISDDALFDFYDQRLPASAVSARHFDSWWKRARQATPDLLTLSEAELDAGGLGADAAFPDEWVQGAFRLPLTYEYSPGSDQDGVTVHIPVHYANQIKPGGFDWQVPGLRQDLVAALIKALPKRLRAELLPARDTARQAVQALGDPADWLGPDGLPVPLASALTKVFQSLRGVFVPPEAWTWEGVPTHLRMDFVVEDANGRTMARGRDLPATVATVIADVSAAIDQVAAASGRARRKAASPPHGAPVRQTQPSGTARRAQPGSDSRPTSSEGGGEAARQTRPGPPGQTASSGGGAAKAPGLAAAPVWTGARDKLTTWDFDELPTEVTVAGSGGDGIGHRNGGSEDRSGSRSGGDGIGHRSGGGMPDVRGYPALVADGGCVALRLLTTEVEAAQANQAGVRELLLGELALPSRRLTSRLAREVALGLAASRYPSVEALTRDAQAAVVDQAVAEAGVPRDRAAYETLRDDLRHALEDRTHPVLLAASGLIAQGRAIETQAERVADLAVLNSAVDVKNHVADLLGDGFLTRAGLRRLPDLRRYLAGDTYRLERLGQARAREEQALWLLADLRRAFEAAAAAGGPALPDPLTEVPWMLEELRVSLLAQPLGTAYPVSEKRIRKVLAAAV
ncbi:MAG: DUF3418 domain-containing protein, partial [Bifidobacteriaceae bacterium]|nr:DUF3418 domain-containing protein [Bifidobacteriaceae bacterium]